MNGATWQARTAVALLIGAVARASAGCSRSTSPARSRWPTILVAIALGWRLRARRTAAWAPDSRPWGSRLVPSDDVIGARISAAFAVVLLLGGCAWFTGRVRERYGNPPWGHSDGGLAVDWAPRGPQSPAGDSMFEIGATLREARERRQLTYEQVEAEIKIRAKYLRALEEEEFDSLPSGTYVRGFLRAYASYLGLDGRLFVDEYASRFGTRHDDELFRRRRERPMTQRRGVVERRARRADRRRRDRRALLRRLALRPGRGEPRRRPASTTVTSPDDTQPQRQRRD